MQNPYLMENKSYLDTVEKSAKAQGRLRDFSPNKHGAGSALKATVTIATLVSVAVVLFGLAAPLYALQF